MMTRTLAFAAAAMLTTLAGCASDATADDAASETEDELRRGPVVLRVPLLDRGKRPLRSHNAELVGKGLAPVTRSTIDFQRSRIDAGKADWKAIADRLRLADRLSFQMAELGEPFEYVTGEEDTICWSGNARKAVEMLSDLQGSVFSTQLAVYAWRHRSGKGLLPGVKEAELPRIWREWSPAGESILVMTTSSDSDEGVNAAIVPKCR